VVCDQHGGAESQVRRRAAERLIMTADHAAQMLVQMMEDTEVPFGVRARSPKISSTARVWSLRRSTRSSRPRRTQSCGSSTGRSATPNNWESNPPPDPTPAIESYAPSSLDHHDAEPEEIVEAEVVEPEGEPANDTPPPIAEMIRAGAFDRKARE
jgi:hypothetical protein